MSYFVIITLHETVQKGFHNIIYTKLVVAMPLEFCFKHCWTLYSTWITANSCYESVKNKYHGLSSTSWRETVWEFSFPFFYECMRNICIRKIIEHTNTHSLPLGHSASSSEHLMCTPKFKHHPYYLLCFFVQTIYASRHVTQTIHAHKSLESHWKII